MNEEAIVVIRDIIKTQLGLDNSNIWIFNQDIKIPDTSGLFVVLETVNRIATAVNTKFVENDTQDGIDEMQYLNFQEEIAIDLISKDRAAQTRQGEVVLSFDSLYGREQQELYQFKIAKINQPFINISEVEGTGMLNRFRLTVTALTWQERKASTVFYDNNFDPEITTDP